jgi:hypothetical protein
MMASRAIEMRGLFENWRSNKMSEITLTLRADDAEPILREAAIDAAKFSAFLDTITRRTGNSPCNSGETLEAARKRWQKRFLRAKRIVESFGVEYQPTSEQETLTVAYPYVGGTTKLMDVGGIKFGMRSGSKPDYDHPYPHYRGEVHAEACRHAGDRVVRTWRATIGQMAEAG